MPLSLFISCILLLAFCQMNETALTYSFKYRKTDKDDTTYLIHIIQKLYKHAGTHTLSLRGISLVMSAICACISMVWIDQWCAMQSWGTPSAVAIKILAVITLTIVGIIGPRAIGIKWADNVLLYSAFCINLINSISWPITHIVLLPCQWIYKRKQQPWNEDAISHLAGLRQTASNIRTTAPSLRDMKIQENDMKIYRNALEFSNVRVKDCIVPRTEILALEENCSLKELLNCFTESGKSKIIIYKEDLDHIIGYIHSSDMFSQPTQTNWKELISEIPVVPESMGAQKMMQIFLQQKKSLAVVADEFGGTSGIISLEDLVEEIFGDIEDEHDTFKYIAKKTGNNEYLISARLEIEKANELLGISLPTSDEYLTVGGMILYFYENFPKENQTVTIGKFNFHIQKASRTQIQLVKLKVTSQEEK